MPAPPHGAVRRCSRPPPNPRPVAFRPAPRRHRRASPEAPVARTAPARDPRYRPFRVAVLTVYLAVVSLFCILITTSVIRSVRAMSPRREPVRTATLAPEACADRASELLD